MQAFGLELANWILYYIWGLGCMRTFWLILWFSGIACGIAFAIGMRTWSAFIHHFNSLWWLALPGIVAVISDSTTASVLRWQLKHYIRNWKYENIPVALGNSLRIIRKGIGNLFCRDEMNLISFTHHFGHLWWHTLQGMLGQWLPLATEIKAELH